MNKMLTKNLVSSNNLQNRNRDLHLHLIDTTLLKMILWKHFAYQPKPKDLCKTFTVI